MTKELIILENKENWRNLVQQQSLQDQFLTLYIAKYDVKALEELEHEMIKKNIDNQKVEFDYKGRKIIGSLIKGKETEIIEKVNEIDGVKVEQFAKDNKLPIYYTETLTREYRIDKDGDSLISETVISNTIDTNKTENEEGFQNSIQEFITSKEEKKVSKSPDRISFKEVK